MIDAESSLTEVAFEVCTALDRVGVTAVLSGGGAATLYAPEAIQSFDVDFILTTHAEGTAPAGALEELGFTRRGHDYLHARSAFQLEFPAGPLAVGGDLIRAWETLHREELLLHVITPTDSCRDRLAAFYHFRDRSSLEQACAVFASTSERIDLDAVESWSQREGFESGYREFQALTRR